MGGGAKLALKNLKALRAVCTFYISPPPPEQNPEYAPASRTFGRSHFWTYSKISQLETSKLPNVIVFFSLGEPSKIKHTFLGKPQKKSSTNGLVFKKSLCILLDEYLDVHM